MARSTLEKSKPTIDRSETSCLDDYLGSILEAIEGEKTPARLLKLAEELQKELIMRKQRRTPN